MLLAVDLIRFWRFAVESNALVVCHVGYHYNADSQMYYDSNTGGYYSGTDKKWYLYDEAIQQFQEWQQQSS